MRLAELQAQLQDIAQKHFDAYSNEKGSKLHRAIIEQVDGIDEITNFTSGNYGLYQAFQIISRTGRVNRETGSRTGAIRWAFVVEFTAKKFTDGTFHVTTDFQL